jgi:hypothetical protein
MFNFLSRRPARSTRRHSRSIRRNALPRLELLENRATPANLLGGTAAAVVNNLGPWLPMNEPIALQVLSSASATSTLQVSAMTAQVTPTNQLPGAIYTTTENGGPVNKNIYDNMSDVYLNGGPDKHGQLPEGDYYFQVTDPSGKTLLSTDDISERKIHISSDGFIDQYLGSHATGTDSSTGAVTVQLMPYLNTPNSGGEYKVWLTPVADYDLSDPKSTFGFVDSNSKTDNFKVRVDSSGDSGGGSGDSGGGGVIDPGPGGSGDGSGGSGDGSIDPVVPPTIDPVVPPTVDPGSGATAGLPPGGTVSLDPMSQTESQASGASAIKVSQAAPVTSGVNSVDVDARWTPAPGAWEGQLPSGAGEAQVRDLAFLTPSVSSSPNDLLWLYGGADEDAKGAIQGFVFGDCNADEYWSPGEPRLIGEDVHLVNETGHVVAVARTDSEGEYFFDHVRPGRYRVEAPNYQEWVGRVSTPVSVETGVVTVDPLGLPPAVEGETKGSTTDEGTRPASEPAAPAPANAAWVLLGMALPDFRKRRQRRTAAAPADDRCGF